MTTTSEAFITPHVLRWARERTNTTPARLAKKLNIKPESIASWESGETKPSLRQAEKLAQKLHVPFAYFFLPAPPADQIPLPDFRTIDNSVFQKATPDLIDLLNDVLAKHTWYRELLQSEGRSELEFVGSFGVDDSPDLVASNIATTLGVTDELRQSCDSWQQFLKVK
jgi:transcriptional regulator with XRE-family HTH domain